MCDFRKTMFNNYILSLCLIILMTQSCLTKAVVEEDNNNQSEANSISEHSIELIDAEKSTDHVEILSISDILTIVKSFKLYTRQNIEEAQELKGKSLNDIHTTYLNTKKSTKFIIHGFIDTSRVTWMKTMKDELLKNSDCNVILVGWWSIPPYLWAFNNVQIVAREVTEFINLLKNNMDLNVENVHLIGHSLGAHIAGFIGKHVNGIGRITGLDPAAPGYFQNDFTTGLNHADAQFVDVIHTGSQKYKFPLVGTFGGLGMAEPCGDIDFYPNGGNNQPGCHLFQYLSISSVIYDKISELLACNHLRSIHLFTESINSNCSFDACQRDSYKQFKEFGCSKSSDIVPMGLNATKPNHVPGTKYFLYTAEKNPYCVSKKTNDLL